MGNLCCDDDFQAKSSLTIRKRHLSNPAVKLSYQHQLESILNNAVERCKQNFHVKKVSIKGRIGKGGQADIFLVEIVEEEVDTHEESECNEEAQEQIKLYAMKRIPKSSISHSDDIPGISSHDSLLLEKQIMSTLDSNSPFLSTISYSCQDAQYIYYVMELATGGDAYSLIHSEEFCGKPSEFYESGEGAVRFLLAGCVLGLQSLHRKKIVYRDLKPENVLIFEDGYPKLADFGISKRLEGSSEANTSGQGQSPKRLCYDVRGTVIYLAPEILQKSGYDYSVDLWALGIFAFELLFQTSPFSDQIIQSPKFKQRVNDFHNSKSQSLLFQRSQFVSDEAKDFIRKLLQHEPSERLGYKSFSDLKSHSFFKGFDWKAYENKTMQSPLRELIKKYPLEVTPLEKISFKEDIHSGPDTVKEGGNQEFTFVRTRAKSMWSSVDTKTSDRVSH